MLAVNGGTLAVIARVFAICGTGAPPIGRLGAIFSSHGTIRGSTYTVSGPAPRDLPTRVIHIRGVARRQLEITFGADLIALGCSSIAAVSTRIATSGRTSTQLGGVAAFAPVANACVAHEVVQAPVAARHDIAIAGPLVHV